MMDAKEIDIEINEDEINKYIERVMNLPLGFIDELWYSMGWIDIEKGNNKSLPDWRLVMIKNNFNFAKESIVGLITNMHGRELNVAVEFLKNLSEMEMKKNER